MLLFTLDETTYARELAPLAGLYPCLKLGPAWWFHDSPEGMMRYRRRTTESAGFYNVAGFNDDTRAFFSIPARHDLARRIDCAYLAELVSQKRLETDEAAEIAADLAYHLPKKATNYDAKAERAALGRLPVAVERPAFDPAMLKPASSIWASAPFIARIRLFSLKTPSRQKAAIGESSAHRSAMPMCPTRFRPRTASILSRTGRGASYRVIGRPAPGAVRAARPCAIAARCCALPRRRPSR